MKMPNSIGTYTHENGGRVVVLFLLFSLAIFQFVTAGYSAFSLVCLSPGIILFGYAIFKWRMFGFWILLLVNYFIHFLARHQYLPGGIPMSMYNEMLEIMLLSIVIIDSRQTPHFERTGNLMLLALAAWCCFCTIEVLNDTCGLGINIGAWYTGARLMAFQMLYIFLVFTIYISSPEQLIKYIRIWAVLSLFSAIWTLKQQYLGFTDAEQAWLNGPGSRTHILNAGTLIRYFSTFSDSANYGCNAGAAAASFIIFSITTKLRRDKIFFLVTALAVIIGMFASGTRTAIFCLGAGLAAYVVLSKSIKIAVPFSLAFLVFSFILVFTTIGQGNQQIRRMRSAFNKDDASANVRDINKETMRKYIKDAPWGIGLGMGVENVPANNKYTVLATIPPDSEYVFIWLRTGPIGLTIFIITTLLMFCGAAWVVMFRLHNRSLIGIGAGFCCSFVAIQLGGYGNQVLMQFPNCLIFYGGLSIVYVLPYIEPAWEELEKKQIAEQEERKRLKLEKKLASRV